MARAARVGRAIVADEHELAAQVEEQYVVNSSVRGSTRVRSPIRSPSRRQGVSFGL